MTPKKILIFGKGQLGTFYRDYFIASGAEVASPVGDIRNAAFVDGAVKAFGPDLALNAAAKTNIDWCELNKTEAFEINTLGADNIAQAAAAAGAYLVHISSGCVQ